MRIPLYFKLPGALLYVDQQIQRLAREAPHPQAGRRARTRRLLRTTLEFFHSRAPPSMTCVQLSPL